MTRVAVGFWLMLSGFSPGVAMGAQPQQLALRADEDYRAGRWREAASAYAQLARDAPEEGVLWYRLGHARHELGRFDSAIEALERADEREFAPARTRYLLSRALARTGRADRATDWLLRAVEAGFYDANAIRTEPDLEGLHDNPLFQAALSQAEEPVHFLDGGDALDFWIGEWDVFVDGEQVGTNQIESTLGGGALREHWRASDGTRGESLFYFLPHAGEWKQVWIAYGARVVKEKTSSPVENGIRFEGVSHFSDGRDLPDRTTLTREDDGRVRQV
ncbi:MAG TPA: tetratricopeptide repeat protein, partial [Myxococcota bacterium]